ncbi:helix-turn-helix domain-containing protein [Streptomyces sp. NPDC005131]
MAINTAAMFARTRFGEKLQQARFKARDGKIKQIQVAQAMGQKTYHRYSRMERGETWPSDKEWKAIVNCLQMDVETRVTLETMRREGMSIASAWWTEFQDEFAESLIEFIAYEDAAAKITTCAGNLVPGLFQTPEYGHAVTRHLGQNEMSRPLMQRSVELRVNRRRVFDKATPPSVEAIIGEGALRQHVGGSDVMLRQLDALIADATERGVLFRVVPFEANATLPYTFHLFEFGGTNEKPIAAFDAMSGMTFWKARKDVQGIRGLVDSLNDLALPPLESLEKIRSVRKELSRD